MKGLDITLQMHIIAKIFDIIKYLKKEKNQKFKKNENRKNGPKWHRGPNFLSCALRCPLFPKLKTEDRPTHRV